MGLLQCSCGYAGDEAGFADHLGGVFIPVHDDIGTDGQAHAELAVDRVRTAGGPRGTRRVLRLACLCGFAAGDAADLDEHLLAVFIPADRIGTDDEKHEPACPAASGAGG